MSLLLTKGLGDAQVTEAKLAGNAVTTAKINADAVDKTKINADIAGLGIEQAAGGELNVKVDDSSIEIATDTVQVKADGITAAMLNTDTAGAGLVANGGTGALDVNVDNSTIEINTDTVRVKADGIGQNEIDQSANLTLTGTLDLTGATVTVPTPTLDAHPATKAYVDATAQGLDVKGSVVCATLPADSAKVLASDFENGDTIDGVVLATGDRILIKNLSTGSQNGVYVVEASGIPTRANDYAAAATVAGTFLFVEEGTQSDSGWVCTNDGGSDVVGTDALIYAQFSGAGSISAGTGLTKNGNTIDIGSGATGNINGVNIAADAISAAVDDSTIEIASNLLALKDDGVTGAKLAAAVAGEGLKQDGSGNLDVDIDSLTVTHTTPDDTDFIAIVDTAGSGNTEKMTVANFKAGLSSENIGCEAHLITSGESTAGYFTLAQTPTGAGCVRLQILGGITQINKQIVGATGATPDFDVLSSTQLHFNNNGAATGLTEDIETDDVVLVQYQY